MGFLTCCVKHWRVHNAIQVPRSKTEVLRILMKKVIIISGGSDGLGRRIASVLAPRHHVLIVSARREKLEKVAQSLGCDYATCDVRDSAAVMQVVEGAYRKYGRIDCLINSAGIWIEGKLEENDPEKIRETLEVNTLGVILLTRAVVPFMKKQAHGLILNINSQNGLQGRSERSVYSASKWAITGFTKSLQLELAKHGITVTGIYPGKMKTKLFEKAGVQKDMSDGLEPDVVAKIVEFVVSLDSTVMLTELGVKHIGHA